VTTPPALAALALAITNVTRKPHAGRDGTREARQDRESGIGGRGGAGAGSGPPVSRMVHALVAAALRRTPLRAAPRRPTHTVYIDRSLTAPVRCGAIHMQFTCQAAGITRTLQSAAEFAAEAVPARARATARAAGMAKRDMMVCCVGPTVRKSSTIPRKAAKAPNLFW